MNRQQFFLMLWIAWGTVCLAALVFIFARPKLWASLIDKENDYWVKRGWLSGPFAQKIKNLEKGAATKIILGLFTLLCALNIYLLLHASAQRRFRAALPPRPVPVSRGQLPH